MHAIRNGEVKQGIDRFQALVRVSLHAAMQQESSLSSTFFGQFTAMRGCFGIGSGIPFQLIQV